MRAVVRWVLLAGVTTLMLGTPPVRAAGNLPVIRYVGSAGCPGPQRFSEEMAAHLKKLPGDGQVAIDVVAVELEGSARARIRFISSKTDSVRDLAGNDCAEVVSAAALVAAVALDTLAQRSPERAGDAGPALAVPAFPDRRPESGKRLAPAWHLGAGAVVQTALAPQPLLGGGAFVGIGDNRGAWDVRLHASYERTGAVERGAQIAEFELLAARLEACPLPIVEAEGFQLHPCAGLELGRAWSAGVDGGRYTGTPEANVWGAAGPLLRARQRVASFSVELFGGAWIPFAGTRSFVFRDPSGATTFHDVPAVGALFGANLAVTP